MTERVLDERALNRALLARQLLLERSLIPIEAAVEQVGGLQTHYAQSAYVGLWTRIAGFRRDDRIVVEPYEELSTRDAGAVESEREALEAFHA